MLVRDERPQDHEAVYEVNNRAFETSTEADLVEVLRKMARPPLSLVAVEENQIVGHILFTPVQIRHEVGATRAMALGPMAVLPEYQRRGIGSKLVLAGLEECKSMGERVVFVLGHPEYYPRFGFEAAAPKGLHYKNEEFDPYFMVAELEKGALAERTGWVEYLPAFDQA